MEIFVLFLLILLAFFVYHYFQYKEYVKNKHAEVLVKEFFSRIVTCKIEKREGEYFLYEEITKQFLAQGKTPKEVVDNLPQDNRFYLSMDGHREIIEELNELESQCMP